MAIMLNATFISDFSASYSCFEHRYCTPDATNSHVVLIYGALPKVSGLRVGTTAGVMLLAGGRQIHVRNNATTCASPARTAAVIHRRQNDCLAAYLRVCIIAIFNRNDRAVNRY